jgi:hypothetical protein
MRSRSRHQLVWLTLSVAALALTACARASNEFGGWRALQPGMELSGAERAGPQGQTGLALLYTVVPGQDYAIESRLPIGGLEGPPSLRLMAKATRVLHLAVVLVDDDGSQHECARTLLPGDWRELNCDAFQPPVGGWAQITTMRFVDRTGELGGQGPVSLKLVGLPLQE